MMSTPRAVTLALASLLSIVPAVHAQEMVHERVIATPASGYLGFAYVSAIDADHRPVFIVDGVASMSPALSKLVTGDVLRSVNGVPATSEEAFMDVIHGANVGDTITFVAQRGKALLAAAIKVSEMSDTRATLLEQLRRRPPTPAATLGIQRIVYVPQKLCYRGFGPSEALPLIPSPGESTVALSEQQGCKQTVDPCTALFLMKQTSNKTSFQRGEWTYRLDGDWTRLTFEDETQCRDALSPGTAQPETAQR